MSPGPPNSNPSHAGTWSPSNPGKSGGAYNIPHVSGHRSRHCESATPPATDEALLPQTKLCRLKATLLHWSHTKNSTKRQFQSLLDTLHHAVSVIPPGRTFTQELTDNMKCLKCPGHCTRFTARAKANISWWLNFVNDWNGVGFFSSGSLQPPDHVITSDASSSWGCDAFSATTLQYFQLQ